VGSTVRQPESPGGKKGRGTGRGVTRKDTMIHAVKHSPKKTYHSCTRGGQKGADGKRKKTKKRRRGKGTSHFKILQKNVGPQGGGNRCSLKPIREKGATEKEKKRKLKIPMKKKNCVKDWGNRENWGPRNALKLKNRTVKRSKKGEGNGGTPHPAT